MICTVCGDDKDIEQFSKSSRRGKNGTGRRSNCKACVKRYSDANRDKIRQSGERYRNENRALLLLKKARERAANKGIPFSITVDDVKAVWPTDGKCPVLGIELKHNTVSGPADSSPTLDAFIPELGYVPGNIHIISCLANSVKRDVTDPTILERVAQWMRKIR